MSDIKGSITSPSEILNNPLNTSTSKFQYSFPQGERFKMSKPYCSTTFYNLPDKRERRAASFGHGQKSDFTQSTVISPSPGSFEKQSDFDIQRSVSQGKTFGLPRDQLKEFGYITQGPLKNPGPGTYQKQSGLSSVQFSIRPRWKDIHGPVFIDGKTSFLSTPAPGAYQQISSINKDGKWMYSQYQGSGATVFNPPTSQRFGQSQYTPGPGQYNPKNDMDKGGRYVLSQYKGYGTRAFPGANRSCFVDDFANLSITPGPGNYRLTSQFGNYDHLDVYRTQEGFNLKGSRLSDQRNAQSSHEFYKSQESSQ